MKFGVVGHGSIGSRHAQNLRTLGHQVIVYDPAYSGSDVGRETGIYDDPSIDAVVICTPSPYHEGPLRACVERGKHIFVEKPISTSAGMLQQLLHAAEKKGLIVMVGNNLRFHPAVMQAKAWINRGAIGVPLWAQFTCAQFNERYDDSVVLNWGAHEVDLAIHLLGPVLNVLSAHVVMDVSRMLDTVADFVLMHESGVRSSFHLDYITPNEVRGAMIAGTEHNIELDLPWRFAALGGECTQSFGGSYDDDYLDEMRAFVEAIEAGGIEPAADGQAGLDVLEVLLDIRKKAGLL